MGETDERILTEAPIRDAATVIVLRDTPDGPAVLMGQRGKSAAFMPNKYVFPGGAVDEGDAAITLGEPAPEPCATRLSRHGTRPPHALMAAAIRELWEETGQIAGTPGDWPDAPADWARFAATGHRPDPSSLRYVFRAVTPPGRPRRFDARFFAMQASALRSDPDDFTEAEDELSHLHWVPLREARKLDLAFITLVVLGEIEAMLPLKGAPDRVPFFRNDEAWAVVDDA